VKIKDMQTGEELTVPVDKAASEIRRLLK